MLPVAILAGGLATRLRPITETIPKSLVEIAGEPFLAHQLRLLRANGVERVVLCVGYLGERIREMAGNGEAFGLRVDYSFDGPTLLGTAGALKRALPLLGDAFFVLYGDSYLPCDWAAAQSAFERSGKPALMSVFLNEGRWDTSNVEYENGRILSYSKKTRTPRMCYIDYGLGILRKDAWTPSRKGSPPISRPFTKACSPAANWPLLNRPCAFTKPDRSPGSGNSLHIWPSHRSLHEFFTAVSCRSQAGHRRSGPRRD